jgi:uncharacterized protein YjbJ (UPF0337 family)
MAEQYPRHETTQTTGQDPLAAQWDHLRGKIASWWDRLTEADLTRVAGKRDQLISVIQERYGYPWERAEQEVDRRLRGYHETTEGVAAAVATALQDAASRVEETTGAAKAARTVANTVARAGAYLPEAPGDLVGLMQRYPIPTLLLGLGVGFLLGSSLGAARLASSLGGRRETSAGPAEAGYPEAMIQCTRCGQMVRQADIVQHSLGCSGSGQPGYGGSPA